MCGLCIMPMTVADVTAAAAIERRSFSMPWTAEAFTDDLGRETSCFLVAKIKEEVVGHIGMWFIGNEAHLTTLAVHPDRRGQGIGERLLVAGITEALRHGIDRMTLEVRSSNEAALNLYRKYGFIPIAIRKKYYEKENEDAVIMWVDRMNAPAYRQKFSSLRDELGAAACYGHSGQSPQPIQAEQCRPTVPD